MSKSNRSTANGIYRRIILTAATAAIMMLLAGCGGSLQQPDQPDGPNSSASAKNVVSPVTIPYLVKNPLVIDTTEETDDDGLFYKRTMSISGLLDKEVEKKISAEIEAARIGMETGEPPGYRGIKRLLLPGSELYGNSIDQSVSYNYNNVLSVIIYNNRTYVTPDSAGALPQDTEGRYEHMIYIGAASALNYDLNTGAPITLKDVFTDDADYIAILNDYLKTKLIGSNADDEGYYGGVEMYGLKLAAPFKGIDEDQDFFLFQGGLGLIFDQDDPEFDTGMNPQMIRINFADLDGKVAVTERFYDESDESADLYESAEPPVKEFMQVWPGADVFENKSETIGLVNVFYSYRYPESIPEEARDKVMELYVPDRDRIQEISALAAQSGEASSYEQYVWASVSGPYTTVVRSRSANVSARWESSTENYCYDADGRLLAIEDIFVPGYDFEAVVRKGLKDAIEQYGREPDLSMDELYDSLTLSIGLSEISFMTVPAHFDEYSGYPVNFYLSFQDIGCDNLTLFD